MPEYVLTFDVGGGYECSSHEHLVFVKFDGDADDLMLSLEAAAQEWIDERKKIDQHNSLVYEKNHEMVVQASKMRQGRKQEDAFQEAKAYINSNRKAYTNPETIAVPGTGKTFEAHLLAEDNVFNQPQIEELLPYIERMIWATEA